MKTIDLQAARELLDFGARIDSPQRAEEQLSGAVALHNLLSEHKCAYLADEVGMGKTFVALGVLALMQHFNPRLRVLVIAPRGNIQAKWQKELSNVVRHNVRFADLRVRGLDGRAAAPLVHCESLLDLVHQSNLRSSGIFFVRMSSFSIGLGGDGSENGTGDRAKLRSKLEQRLPWLRNKGVLYRRQGKQEFKDDFARALCCALPTFDLVIVDEAHNLKRGFKSNSSARNRVMAQAMGHPESAGSKADFPGYGSRARHVLFLSATPIEESYTQLWNQLDVFGHGKKFPGLIDKDLTDDQRKAVAQRFLVRRVTSLKLGEEELTKNLYRREWRRGGVAVHDDPIRVTDPRQRLVLALVQKKVAETIGHEKFGSSFQMGMLASFESFQQTAMHTRARSGDADEPSNFDDSEQTELTAERLGVDVRSVNRLAKSHRRLFGQELPHPKMDAIVDDLSRSWRTGEKALVFVRRIASVKDLKRKLDERYDRWLCERLLRELPPAALPKLQQMIARYREENREFRDHGNDAPIADEKHEDEGGHDTFFAWYFRGKRPERVLSGARLLQRFSQKGSVYAAFFEDNHTAALLQCDAADTLRTLSTALQLEEHVVRAELSTRARCFLTTRAKKLNRLDAFEAVQAAAVQWLAQSPGPWQESARLVFHERFTAATPSSQTPHLPVSAIDRLNLPTFFSEIRRAGREDLRASLWPEAAKGDAVSRYRESALRAELLSSAARLGHGLIDLYLLTIQQLNSLELGPRADGDDDEAVDGAEAVDFAEDRHRIAQYLDMLEAQRGTVGTRDWRCFDELADISANYDLIVDVNLPDARGTALADVRKEFGTKLLGAQQPVGGMHGSVNGRLVKQFRMPGYPLVLVTTDLLQEGEDLHTFCSRIHHYGISWTPSSMEQRTGRIDRVRSHTERRLLRLQAAAPEHRLQVHFPHLEDTVEVLQVRRLLTRMNTFLRLMHEGLHVPQADERTLDVGREILRHHEPVTAITERLQTAFPVNERDVAGTVTTLARTAVQAQHMEQRFQSLRQLEGLEFEPAEQGEAGRGRIFGSVRLPNGRVQPFGLYLQSFAQHPLVRCISPVGRDLAKPQLDEVLQEHDLQSARIGALDAKEDQSYDLTVEEDTLLAAAAHDLERVRHLIARVTHDADAVEKRLLEHDKPLSTFLTDLQHE